MSKEGGGSSIGRNDRIEEPGKARKQKGGEASPSDLASGLPLKSDPLSSSVGANL